MFEIYYLKNVLEMYKKDFAALQWDNEKFKWEAIKYFQDNWDIDAPDFANMLMKSFAKTHNLLASRNNFPAKMITKFAQIAPEEVRTMYRDLFDENIDIVKRIEDFKTQSKILLEKYGNGANQHYQHENAISIYLWLRYPDKYYIYKFNEIKTAANALKSDYSFKKGAYADNIHNSICLYHEICEKLQQDDELIALFKSRLTEECYPDPKLKTLTVDVVFYISRFYSQHNRMGDAKDKSVSSDNSCLAEYSPDISEKSLEQLLAEEGHSYWWLRTDQYPGPFETEFEPEKENCNIINKIKMDESKTNAAQGETLNVYETYTKMDFLHEVYIDSQKYDILVSLLRNKKNIILQGAPGVGKTFAAKRLAYSIMEAKDDSRIEYIQFHQNYSYEDFIMGYKPTDRGFKLTNGIFYQFCMKAASNPDKDYFFLIDEINRGNMSKIFGELLMLIERDYRGQKITLAYSGTAFSIPGNLYLIGMMNTADRSLSMVDYALRRRFSFFHMEPGFKTSGFKAYQTGLNSKIFDHLIECIIELNQEIEKDDSLGDGFLIGHSYFCGQKICTKEWMKEIVFYDIIPMLQEYWFDDKQKLQRWKQTLIGVFHDE